MKIRLSEDEVYEIKLPEEIGMTDFQGVVAKFNVLLKNFGKFNIGESPKENGEIVLSGEAVKQYKKRGNKRWITLKENKDIYFELLKTHYFGTLEDFENVLNKHNIDFKKSDMSCGKIIALREYHKIKPQELGLRKFPTKFEQIHTLKLGDNKK